MVTVEDTRLEELRKFLIGPTQMRTPEELTLIARDLIRVIESEQLRRVGERVAFTPKPKPYALFGSTEAVLKYVEENKIPDDRWLHIDGQESIRNLLPRQVQGVQLEGTPPELWKAWEDLCKTYEVAA